MARYKVLKGVAQSFAHSFTSLMNYRGTDYVLGHLLRRAREVGHGKLTVDVLTGYATPKSLLVPEVAASVASYCAWFPVLIKSHRTDLQYVRSTILTVDFDLSVARSTRYAPNTLESPYVCRVEIVDDRGKTWAAEISDWWFPETENPNRRSKGRSHVRTIVRLGQVIRSIWMPRRPNSRLAA